MRDLKLVKPLIVDGNLNRSFSKGEILIVITAVVAIGAISYSLLMFGLFLTLFFTN